MQHIAPRRRPSTVFARKKSFSNRAFAVILAYRFFYGKNFLPHHRNRLCQRLPAPRARLRENSERRRRPPQAHARNPNLLSDGPRRARAEGAAERAARGRGAVGSLRQAGGEVPEPLQNPQCLQRRLYPHLPAAPQGGGSKDSPGPLRPRGNTGGFTPPARSSFCRKRTRSTANGRRFSAKLSRLRRATTFSNSGRTSRGSWNFSKPTRLSFTRASGRSRLWSFSKSRSTTSAFRARRSGSNGA